jgi:hypothetical protein
MLVPIPYVHVGMGLGAAIVSVPLILRMVPMNRAYGIRIRKAFVSPANWYAINAFAGKVMLVLGLLLMGFGLLAQDLAPPPSSPAAPLFLVAPLAVAILVGFVLIGGFARRLPDR